MQKKEVLRTLQLEKNQLIASLSVNDLHSQAHCH